MRLESIKDLGYSSTAIVWYNEYLISVLYTLLNYLKKRGFQLTPKLSEFLF